MDTAQEIENLWPSEFGTSDTLPPVVILKQQATMLGQLTHNILQGEVTSGQADHIGVINHNFYIVAPALDNYRYYLLRITHNVTDLYPVMMSGEQQLKLDDEKTFRDALRELFTSEKTREVVQSLLAQSEAYPLRRMYRL